MNAQREISGISLFISLINRDKVLSLIEIQDGTDSYKRNP